jgi:hypothetical protein
MICNREHGFEKPAGARCLFARHRIGRDQCRAYALARLIQSNVAFARGAGAGVACVGGCDGVLFSNPSTLLSRRLHHHCHGFIAKRNTKASPVLSKFSDAIMTDNKSESIKTIERRAGLSYVEIV